MKKKTVGEGVLEGMVLESNRLRGGGLAGMVFESNQFREVGIGRDGSGK